jgi:ABC-type phosphate/phosphonate transport system substrate-binding protein
MKNRSKLMIVAAVAASCVLLAGCGSSASSTASSAASSESAPGSVVLSQVESALPDDGTNSPDELADEVNALLEANPIANQFEIAAMNIEYDFGLKAEDVAGYKGVKSNDNGDAGLVLVIEPAEGKADDIVEALKAYQQDQVAFYGNYAEFATAQANVENAVIASSADRVVMAIASNECTEDLTDAVNDVLLK